MATQRPQQSSLAPFIVLAGVAAAGVAVAYLLPGTVAIWLGVVAAAWMEPQAIVTGPKINGRLTPLDEREKKGQQTYQIWKDLQTGLFLPRGIIPGWPMYWSWVAGLAAAAVSALLPVSDPWYRLANAVAAFVIAVQVPSSLRAAKASPGTRFDSYKKAVAEKAAPLIATTVGGAVLGAATGFGIAKAWTYAPAGLQQAPAWSWVLGCSVLGLVTLSGIVPSKVAHEHWREVMAARKDWDPRWETLKASPAPVLADVRTVGTAQLFSFTVAADVAPFIEPRRAGQVSALLGGGIRMAALTCPNEHNGQPVPGTVHPNKFQIAVWPSDQMPDLFSPETDDESRLLMVRADYQSRWDNMKVSPAPVVIGSQLVGSARVDTFAAGHAGASIYWPLAPKLAVTFPGVSAMAVMPEINADGLRSQQTFTIVSWSGELPDITDAAIDDDVARLAIETAIIRVCEDARYGVPVLAAADRISDDDAPVTWEVRLDFPDGPSMLDLRTGGMGPSAARMLAADCVVDHRDGNGVMWMGALDPDTIPRDIARRIEEEAEEDRFRGVWAQALKMNMTAPRPQPKLKQTRSLVPDQATEPGRRPPQRAPEQGPKVTRYAFGIPQGVDPETYFGYEERIKTAFFPTTFLATTGLTEHSKGRPGDRAQRLLVLYHSADTVPQSPDLLAPCKAAEWVLSGMVNQAFKAARLIQPEVVANKSRCLTVPGSRGHIWRIVVRLYGGNNLSDVRAARTRLATGFGSPWLRVTSGDEEGLVVLYVGVDPKRAKLARPAQDRLDLDSRDWEQAFIDAGATGSGGLLPALTATGTMPHNDKVMVLDFSLPSGLDVPTVKKVLPKLKASTGNEFIEVRPGKGGASTITILASVDDPMPARAGYDYDIALASSAIPFATGVDGEPVVYDWMSSPQLLVAGATGGGKSACLQQLITGGVLRGAQLFVIDPTKGAADFRFAEPWASCVATDIHEAAAAMKGVYQEVVRRKSLNSEHGVGSYRDLPAEIRPRHIILVIDEFTSLMGPDPVSKTPYDDPDSEVERQHTLASNNAKIQIGTYTGKIGREARSAGVTLLLATQKLSADMLSKLPGAADLKTNMARILLGNTTYGDRQSALRMPDSAPDLGLTIPIGRGIFESSISAPVAMQVWYDTTDKLGAFLAEHVTPTDESFDVTPYLIKETDRSPSVSEVSLDSEFDMDEFVDLGDLELDLSDLELTVAAVDDYAPPSPVAVVESPESPQPEAPSVASPTEVQSQEPETAASTVRSPWDRPWGVAEPVVATSDPEPAAEAPQAGRPASPKSSHKRADLFARQDF